MSVPPPPPYGIVAREIEARAAGYRDAGDWPALLSLRLRVAARYPRLADPFGQLINDYVSVVVATRSPLPQLAPLAAAKPAATPTVRADALALDRMQGRLVDRLEGFAAQRDIRIRTRRHVRPALSLTQYGPCLPWFGPPLLGIYLVSPLPRRGRSLREWRWPRLGMVIADGPVNWRPVLLAHLLVQLGVFMGQHRRRAAALERVGRELSRSAGVSPRARRAAMADALQGVEGPRTAVHRGEASGAIQRGYSRLLVWLLRDELRAQALPPSRLGEPWEW